MIGLSDTIFVSCEYCSHYKGGMKCNAFPSGIPEELFSGDPVHIDPYPGDNGIQFEAKPGVNLGWI